VPDLQTGKRTSPKRAQRAVPLADGANPSAALRVNPAKWSCASADYSPPTGLPCRGEGAVPCSDSRNERASTLLSRVQELFLDKRRPAPSVPALLAVFLLLTACTFFPEPATQGLRFGASVSLNGTGETVIDLSVRNLGRVRFPGDDGIGGCGEIQNGARQLLSRFTLHSIGTLAPGEVTHLVTWHSKLAPGQYTMTFTTLAYGGVELKFTLVQRFGELAISQSAVRPLPPDK
jgi:hypothetical protein